MEWNIATLNGLLSEHTTRAQYELMEIFNQLVNTPNGWKDCIILLIKETHNLIGQAVFFFLRVVESFVTSRYANASDEERNWLREFFATWLDRNLQQPGFVRNKTAQLLALICVIDCPSGRWPSFFDDLINFASAYGGDHPLALDMVLRVLKALDGEVADRDISLTAERAERNTLVKDWMRDHCVQKLAAWWLHVMTTFKDRSEHASLVCFCLEVVSLYISWVPIDLVANEAYLSVFLHLLEPQPGLCREAVCDCLSAVVAKGMNAPSKVQLVQQLSDQLGRAGVFEVIGPPGAGLPASNGSEDVEYLSKLSALINQMGLQVMEAYNSFMKANATEEATMALTVFETKVDLSLNLLAFDDEEVSRNVSPIIQSYLSLLKPLAQQGLSDTTKVRIEMILRTIFSRLKYDDLYDFDNEGEEEAIFQDYRKTMRVLMTNLTQLAPDLVLEQTQRILQQTLSQWKVASWNDVELAIALFYQLGEAVSVTTMSLATSTSPVRPTVTGCSSARKRAPPNPVNIQQANAIRDMLVLLCQSGVIEHSHVAVIQQYFETVSRYERVFLALEKPLLEKVVMDFLSDHGLKSTNERIRVRCAYLFSRFIKTHKASIEDHRFANNVLAKLTPLLTLPQTPDRASATSPCSSLDSDSGGSSASSVVMDSNGLRGAANAESGQQAVSEQGYLFETASFIIVSCAIPVERKAELVTAMLSPIVSQVPKLCSLIVADSQKAGRANPRLQMLYAESIRTCMDYACRSSKAFSSTSTMEQCGCVDIYAHTLRVFIKSLHDLPLSLVEPRSVMANGLRIYLHRLVVCLGDEILPHFGHAARELLSSSGLRDLADFLPLLNQLMTKYKHRAQATMAELLSVLVTCVLDCLSSEAPAAGGWSSGAAAPGPCPDGSAAMDMHALEEFRRLRRSFFLFVAALFQWQPVELFLQLEAAKQQQLLTAVVAGAMDVTDPQAQKGAFGALRQLVLVMPAAAPYQEFLLNQVVPACLVAPARPEFDLRDAQTVLVLNECAACQKALLDKFGDDILRYLGTEALPKLNFPPSVAAEYLQALKNWNLKEFQQFLKKFYTNARHNQQSSTTNVVTTGVGPP